MEITLPDSDLDGILQHPLVQGLLECSSDGAVVIDAASRRVLAMNARARELLADGADRSGCQCTDVLDSPACAQACPLTRASQGLPADGAMAIYYRRPDAQLVHATSRMLVIRGPGGTPLAGIELIQDQRDLYDLERALRSRRSLHGLVGRSGAMQRVFDRVDDLAPCDLPVLIIGEEGSGKRRTAEALHAVSRRQQLALVIQAADLPREGGAGVLARALSKAAGGSLLLCRIDDAHAELRDVLTALVTDGVATWQGRQLRSDGSRLLLTARRPDQLPRLLRAALAGSTIELPPLSQRLDDLPLLVDQLLGDRSSTVPPSTRCAPATLAALCNRPWPGNIRQLAACLHAAVIRAGGGVIAPEHLDATADPPSARGLGVPISGEPAAPTLAELEAHAIDSALHASDGNVSAAARLLGIDRSTLWRKLKRSANRLAPTDPAELPDPAWAQSPQ